MMSVSRLRFMQTSLVAGLCGTAMVLRGAFASEATLAIDSPNLFPESFAYLASTDRFYVGSLRYGRVSSVAADGTIKTLCADPRLKSTFGIIADESRGVVHACNADLGISVRSQAAGVGQVCSLATIDARTGAVLAYVDLSGLQAGRHLPNDAAIASDGSIYVTDSLSPVVYRIPKRGQAERFVSDPRFAATAPAAGLDGIAVAASGTIVVNHISHGAFFRIDPRTKAVSQIALAGGDLKGCDGMRFGRDGRLIVAQSTLAGPSRNALNELTSHDDWRTASVSKSWALTATTYQSVRTKTGVYGVQSRLEQLFHDPKGVHVPGFSIVKISA
jgi:sugar lactone lactonase YvrE